MDLTTEMTTEMTADTTTQMMGMETTMTQPSSLATRAAATEGSGAPAIRPSAFPVCPRDANGRFLPGAPGRQPGQRNLISGRVARYWLRNFETRQDELLARMQRWWLPQYMRMTVQLLPKNGTEGIATEAGGELNAAELVAALKEALAAAEAAAATAAEAG